MKNTCAETLIPCLDGPGAPHASLPSSCALGRQRVQRRRLHWHCFQQQEQQQQLLPPAAPACCARRATKRDGGSKLPSCTPRRLHSCCPCMLLDDSVQLRCPRHATSHRSIYRRGGTRRWLLTSSSCLLGHVVCLGKSCTPPQGFVYRATAEAPWVAALWFVLTLWTKKKQKRLTKK